MITYGFDFDVLMCDVRSFSVALGKLKIFSFLEILNAKANGDDAVVLKCRFGHDCLGFMNSSNENSIHVETISHLEYANNRTEDFELLMKDFYRAISFTVDLVVEIKSGKDMYLVTDVVTGDLLIISTDVQIGDDSDHVHYRDAKDMGLMD